MVGTLGGTWIYFLKAEDPRRAQADTKDEGATRPDIINMGQDMTVGS